jgi:hypothetical protein
VLMVDDLREEVYRRRMRAWVGDARIAQLLAAARALGPVHANNQAMPVEAGELREMVMRAYTERDA